MMARTRKVTRSGDLSSPETMASRLVEFMSWLATRNYSPETIVRMDRSISVFVAWCEEREVVRPTGVTRTLLERYARHLYAWKTPRGGVRSARSQHNDLSALRQYFKYLARRDYVAYSPAADLELPKIGQSLPRVVLTHVEMEQVLSQPDVKTRTGVRDRSILEMQYSTGLRRHELTSLRVHDLDRSQSTVMVRQGKGRKDRVVPLGERAQDWAERYLLDVRPSFVRSSTEDALYLSEYGERLSDDGLSGRVSEYVKRAELGKLGSCHLFRHTMATVMLEGGADVRVIQEMLGHSSLKATQIYTRVSIRHLREVHAATHPSARRGALGVDAPGE